MSHPTHLLTFLLADDHSLIRQGLVFLIEDMEVEAEIFHASNLSQILECVKANKIDIAIIDAHFPDGNSLGILSEIKKTSPDTNILILSGIEENQNAIKFISAGANGFLSKLSEEEDVKQAIQAMVNDGEYLSAATQALLLDSLRNKNLINPLEILTEREMEIARMYAQGLGNLEIANRLDIKQNTVSTLKKRIFEKLKIDNIIELVSLMNEHNL